MLYVDKEKIQTIIAQQRTTPAEVDYFDLDSAAKLVENFENPAIDGEKVSKTTEIGETRPAVRAGIEGVIHGDVPALSAENKRLSDERKAAVKAVTSLRGAMSRQRAYDRGTVKLVTDLASDLMARGLLDRMAKNKHPAGRDTSRRRVR